MNINMLQISENGQAWDGTTGFSISWVVGFPMFGKPLTPLSPFASPFPPASAKGKNDGKTTDTATTEIVVVLNVEEILAGQPALSHHRTREPRRLLDVETAGRMKDPLDRRAPVRVASPSRSQHHMRIHIEDPFHVWRVQDQRCQVVGRGRRLINGIDEHQPSMMPNIL